MSRLQMILAGTILAGGIFFSQLASAQYPGLQTCADEPVDGVVAKEHRCVGQLPHLCASADATGPNAANAKRGNDSPGGWPARSECHRVAVASQSVKDDADGPGRDLHGLFALLWRQSARLRRRRMALFRDQPSRWCPQAQADDNTVSQPTRRSVCRLGRAGRPNKAFSCRPRFTSHYRWHPGVRNVGMAHEAAKLLLQQAESNEQRTEAVRAALALGMPLSEIEAYLDWLDSARPPARDIRRRSPASWFRRIVHPPAEVTGSHLFLHGRQRQLPQGLQGGQNVRQADFLPVGKPVVHNRQLETVEGVAKIGRQDGQVLERANRGASLPGELSFSASGPSSAPSEISASPTSSPPASRASCIGVGLAVGASTGGAAASSSTSTSVASTLSSTSAPKARDRSHCICEIDQRFCTAPSIHISASSQSNAAWKWLQ